MSEMYSVGRDVHRIEERLSDHETNAEMHAGVDYECAGCTALRSRVEALEAAAALAVEAAARTEESAADAEAAAARAEAAADAAQEEAGEAEAAAVEAAEEVEEAEPVVAPSAEPPAVEAADIADVAPERAHILHRKIGGS